MVVRSRMIHRCTVWRNVPGDTDPYGDFAMTPEVHASDLPCYIWNAVGRGDVGEVTASDRDYILHEYRMVIPKATDVSESDYIQGITDRRGDTMFGTRMDIKAVIPRPTHTLLMLQEVT